MDIAYSVTGEGPAFVFVRGWVSHLDLMWNAARFHRFFSPITRDYRLIRYDTRGNGLSTRKLSTVNLDDLVLDLETVVSAATSESEPLVLFSHGLAAPIAMAYASKHPERVSRLVLDGAFLNGADLAPAITRKAFKRMLPILTRMPESVFYMLSHLTHPAEGGDHDHAVAFAKASIDGKTAQLLYALALEVDVEAEAGSIQAPTLVLHREESKAVPFDLGRKVAAVIPRAEFLALSGSAQNPWDGDSGETLSAMGRFLGHHWELPPEEPKEPQVRVVLFTDIEGHTEMMSRLGDGRGREVLREHESITREALRRSGGTEVKAMGDGFMAWFGSASRAVECAVALQRGFARRNDSAEVPFSIRVGINAGEPVEEDDDLFGESVIAAARIAAAAEGGEILVADVVRQLATGKGLLFDDVGEHRLRGLAEPKRLCRVRWDS